MTANEHELQELKASTRGQLIDPQHLGYETARRVYNAAIERRPRLIVRCLDAADVLATVRYAAQSGTLLAVRGGGHSGPGFGTCDDGVVADLSRMRGVRVDPQARTVRVEGGATWGDVDHATHPFGLAVPSGVVSTTGVGGLTLGGGHGYLARRYGLTIDNLLEADVVLADGRLVTASREQLPDLFWALRGGGGNFGVVTSFLFRAHSVRHVFAGPMLWPVEQTATVLPWYGDFLRQAPRELYGFFLVMNVPPVAPFPAELHARPVCGVLWCYLGAREQAEQALQPVRRALPPAFEHLGVIPFPTLQSSFDGLLPPGLQWFWKGDFVNTLEAPAIARHAEFGARLPSLLSIMHLYPIDGAVHEVAREATAFSYRDTTWSMVIAGIDPQPDALPSISAWAHEYWQALHPYSSGGAYVNFMMQEGAERLSSTFRDNYARLKAIKRTYDPHNLFRVNHNIAPA